jgi:hypothetical protein
VSTSTITGSIGISGGVAGAPITGSATPTMAISFDNGGVPVHSTIPQFVATGSVAIRGTGPFNGWYTDICTDTQTVSGVGGQGTFDPATGSLAVPSTITIKHSLSAGPMTGPWGYLGCPGTVLPDDVVAVTLSTSSPGGSALDANGPGQITLVGTGSAGQPTAVAVTVSGVLAPRPSACTQVLVPDVRDDSKTQADQAIRAAGLKPLFNLDPGHDSYVAWQSPAGDTCVSPGSIVRVTLVRGPRP